jgi:hypothetical protein
MTNIEKLTRNILYENEHNETKKKIVSLIPELMSCNDNSFLSLYKYLMTSPHKYYSLYSYQFFGELLTELDNTQHSYFLSYYYNHETELNSALIHLAEINKSDFNDCEYADDHELIQSIDMYYNNAYLKLLEAVYTPLTRIIAQYLRIKRGIKPDENLGMFNIAEELDHNGIYNLTMVYNDTIRNGIAHGGIIYLQNNVKYTDKKGKSIVIGYREFIELYDDLIDSCNGLALAIIVFLFKNTSNGYKLLDNILIDELKVITKTYWWEIINSVHSEYEKLNQLLIYAKVNTTDVLKVNMSVFISGIKAELYAKGFDRYFFLFRDRNNHIGWASFDGNKLKKLREEQCEDLKEYTYALNDNLIFFVPKKKYPEFIYKLQGLAMAFAINYPRVINEIKTQLGIPDMCFRKIKSHRNGYKQIVNAELVINENPYQMYKCITKNMRRIFNKCYKESRKENKKVFSFLPFGYVSIDVYKKDYRIRKLNNYGLGEDLVCRLIINKTKKISTPVLFNSKIEKHGKIWVEWNKEYCDKYYPIEK